MLSKEQCEWNNIIVKDRIKTTFVCLLCIVMVEVNGYFTVSQITIIRQCLLATDDFALKL